MGVFGQAVAQHAPNVSMSMGENDRDRSERLGDDHCRSFRRCGTMADCVIERARPWGKTGDGDLAGKGNALTHL